MKRSFGRSSRHRQRQVTGPEVNGEIHFDVDKLSPPTVRQLQKYVASLPKDAKSGTGGNNGGNRGGGGAWNRVRQPQRPVPASVRAPGNKGGSGGGGGVNEHRQKLKASESTTGRQQATQRRPRRRQQPVPASVPALVPVPAPCIPGSTMSTAATTAIATTTPTAAKRYSEEDNLGGGEATSSESESDDEDEGAPPRTPGEAGLVTNAKLPQVVTLAARPEDDEEEEEEIKSNAWSDVSWKCVDSEAKTPDSTAIDSDWNCMRSEIDQREKREKQRKQQKEEQKRAKQIDGKRRHAEFIATIEPTRQAREENKIQLQRGVEEREQAEKQKTLEARRQERQRREEVVQTIDFEDPYSNLSTAQLMGMAGSLVNGD